MKIDRGSIFFTILGDRIECLGNYGPYIKGRRIGCETEYVWWDDGKFLESSKIDGFDINLNRAFIPPPESSIFFASSPSFASHEEFEDEYVPPMTIKEKVARFLRISKDTKPQPE